MKKLGGKKSSQVLPIFVFGGEEMCNNCLADAWVYTRMPCIDLIFTVKYCNDTVLTTPVFSSNQQTYKQFKAYDLSGDGADGEVPRLLFIFFYAPN